LKGKPLIVGLTGGFATGKTTVAGALKQLGADVVNCDSIAHRALSKDSSPYRKILKRFGPSIVDRRGRVLKKRLAAIVFENKKERVALEQIVHPFVFEVVERRVKRSRKKVIVLEMPLLYETNFDKQVDRVVVVAAPEFLQIERARKDRGMSAGEAKKRISSQMPLPEKIKRADYVIHNNGNRRQLARGIKILWSQFMKITS